MKIIIITHGQVSRGENQADKITDIAFRGEHFGIVKLCTKFMTGAEAHTKTQSSFFRSRRKIFKNILRSGQSPLFFIASLLFDAGKE